MQTSTFPSVRALDQLLDGLGAGAARRRQLDMARGELERALNHGALPVGARRSLRRLLEKAALAPYVRLAESGVLRHRRVAGGCEDFLQRAHGTSKLWVSRWMNHDGVLDDGHTTIRPPEMPLEGERPRRLLPGRPAAVRRAAPAAAFKLEALRCAVDAERQRTAV